MIPSLITQPAAEPRPRRPPLLWVAGAAGVVIALGVAAYVSMLWRMTDVPADLDYAATRTSAAGLYRVMYTEAFNPIPINKLHTWTLHVETAAGQPVDQAAITVKGGMPQHGHGMPTKPQVTRALGGGDYLVEGMKFQMGGWWVVAFDITANGQTDQVSFNLLLPK